MLVFMLGDKVASNNINNTNNKLNFQTTVSMQHTTKDEKRLDNSQTGY